MRIFEDSMYRYVTLMERNRRPKTTSIQTWLRLLAERTTTGEADEVTQPQYNELWCCILSAAMRSWWRRRRGGSFSMLPVAESRSVGGVLAADVDVRLCVVVVGDLILQAVIC